MEVWLEWLSFHRLPFSCDSGMKLVHMPFNVDTHWFPVKFSSPFTRENPAQLQILVSTVPSSREFPTDSLGCLYKAASQQGDLPESGVRFQKVSKNDAHVYSKVSICHHKPRRWVESSVNQRDNDPFWYTFLQKLDIISITALPKWRLLANCFKN